jgi:hypothetical protein
LLDIKAVLDDPSAITAQETEAAGFTPWTALKFFRDCLQEGEARAVFVDGEIAFVLGIAPHPLLPRRASLWFVSTERYWKTGAAGVRFGRAFLRSLAEKYPGEWLVARSWSRHPDVERWFALLGFKLSTATGLSREFVRPPKAVQKGDRLSSI